MSSQKLDPALVAAYPPTDDRRPLVVGVTSFLWGLSTLGVFMRFLVRRKRRIHGWDDYLLYLSWAVGTLGVPDAVLISRAGLGLHIIYLSPAQISEMLKWASIGQLEVATGVGLVRFSLCILIMRLIERTHRKTHWFLYGVITINIILTVVGVFLIAFQCTPFKKRWEPLTPGRCFDVELLTYSTRVRGIIGCLLDFACVAASFIVFRNLQVKRKIKYMTIALMSLGVVTAACSIGKAVTSEFKSTDFSYTQVVVYLWSGAEHYLGIFVACLPTARPFLLDIGEASSYFSRLIPSRARTRDSRTGGTKEFSSSGQKSNLNSNPDIELARPERL